MIQSVRVGASRHHAICVVMASWVAYKRVRHPPQDAGYNLDIEGEHLRWLYSTSIMARLLVQLNQGLDLLRVSPHGYQPVFDKIF